MAHWQSSSLDRNHKKTSLRKWRATHKVQGLSPRTLSLEPFEERAMLAVGPHLVAVIPSAGSVLTDGQILHTAPTELTFRFDSAVDPNSVQNSQGVLTGIQITRGGDHILGNNNDITIVPGYVGIGDNSTDVIVRFASALPDDLYQLRILGTGATPLKGITGGVFNNGVDVTEKITLDLGAQVVSIVPQPVSRNGSGQLTQATNEIDVYFNSNDPLDPVSAQNKTFYQLIRTNGAGAESTPINPGSVSYNALTGKAVLLFGQTDLTTPGSYRLRVGNSDPLALYNPNPTVIGTPGSSFDPLDPPADLGTIFTNVQGTQALNLKGFIGGSPVRVILPGGDNDPGTRNIGPEDHLIGGSDTSGVIPVYTYNFQSILGTVTNTTVFNLITEVQKQRVREVLAYYANYLGVEFVETANSGWTIGTGDVRVVDPTIPAGGVGGIAGGGEAVMNGAVNWGNSEAGGSYFQTAMHEIGHLLGLGHTYELPALAIQGSAESTVAGTPAAEGVFPGDSDILLGQYLHPTVGNDIQMYQFNLARNGTVNFETFAERLRQLDATLNPSQLNTVISVYDSNHNLIARNDDSFGNDSFVQLQLTAGKYYVAVTSTGNTNFDPTIPNTGAGGRTEGNYQLRMTFTPTPTDGIKDTTGTLLDGDADGVPGGVNNFWFTVATQTLFVDKSNTQQNPNGSLANPYKDIATALAFASPGSVVRIVGNSANLSYNVGFDNQNRPLSDGTKFEVPQDVTVMVDAGAIIKLRGASIDVGTATVGIDRSGGALQVLGTPSSKVNITSYYDSSIGTDPGTAKDPKATPGNWGGIILRGTTPGDIYKPEIAGIFLNYINYANINYAGGNNFDSIYVVSSRPTITNDTITNSADAAISADPNSFQETNFQGASFVSDYSRVGPSISGNLISANSINGLFVRIRTDAQSGQTLDPLTVSARFANIGLPYVVEENLQIQGSVVEGQNSLAQPGEFYIDGNGRLQARPGARLSIDPGVLVKLGGARIETQVGGQFIAEGTAAKPIIFTSIFDDTYGGGGTFDTNNDTKSTTPGEGNWGGLFFGPLSIGSVDHALIQYAGGTTTVEGGYANFDTVEIHQAQVRLTNSTLQHNGAGATNTSDSRAGRSSATPAIIFVRGAQPVIMNNIIQNNDVAPLTSANAIAKNTAAISINVNSLNSQLITDWGRSTGKLDLQGVFVNNDGPLVRGNELANNPINGMIVRGGTVTTDVVFDDTDIVHVVENSINTVNQFSLTGTVRLQSNASESLVVKLAGSTAGFSAGGTPLDITDRTGGTVQVVGVPSHPVVMTSLYDATVGAGFTPSGKPQNDTANANAALSNPLPTNSGPVFLDGGDRDDHGFADNKGNEAGWKFIQQALNFAYSSSLNTAGDGILVIGVQQGQAGSPTQAEAAIISAAAALTANPTLKFVTGAEISTIDFSQYKMIYVPSDAFDTDGGISDADIALLTARKNDLQNYVDNQGGGLVALTEDQSATPYSWLALPDPFTIQHAFGYIPTTTLTQSAALAAAGFNISDAELSAGTPWHNSFIGPPGFDRLQPWVIDPNSGSIVTLGLAAGAGGIGSRLSTPQSGDWAGITLGAFSNDTNMAIVNEQEQGFSAAGDTNGLPSNAQLLGNLAKNINSGDDNQRLGFEVHGSISQTVASPGGGDVDVYKFQATAGSTVWLDIDRTASALDSVVELVDQNGAVIARSDNSITEQANPYGPRSTLFGDPNIAKPMQMGFNGSAGPFTNPDYYSTNPKDAGMRVDLPGPANSTNTYYVRVRASSSDLTHLNGGLTKGEYVLQVRLQNLDQFPGSTVQNADIRYATSGVQLIGKPETSPLLSNTAETTSTNNTISTAQNIGNLLGSSTASLSVAGNLPTSTSVAWFKMNITYDLIQAIKGASDGLKTLSAIFNINYADGVGGPDTTLSVFDQYGNLILMGRDSNVPDNQNQAGSTPLQTGSYGALDPTIGTIQMPAGVGTSSNPDTGARTYYVAVSSNGVLPEILDASLKPIATNSLVRLEPINSVARVVDDRVGSSGGTTATVAQQIFPGTTPQQLNVSATPLTLGNVVLYVNTAFGDLSTVNPLTGAFETAVTNPNGAANISLPNVYPLGSRNQEYYDIAMRDDGRLYAISQGVGSAFATNNNNNYVSINPNDGSALYSSTVNFAVSDLNATTPTNTAITSPTGFTYNFTSNTTGIAYNALTFGYDPFSSDSANGETGRALFALGNRSDGNGIAETQNLLFRLNATTGAPLANGRDDMATISNNQNLPGAPYSTYQPFAPNALSTTQSGSGTDTIPVGHMATGQTIIASAATDPNPHYNAQGVLVDNSIKDGYTFQIAGTTYQFVGVKPAGVGGGAELSFILGATGTPNTSAIDLTVASKVNNGDLFVITQKNGQQKTFQFVTPGNATSLPGYIAIGYTQADSLALFAGEIVNAVNSVNNANFAITASFAVDRIMFSGNIDALNTNFTGIPDSFRQFTPVGTKTPIYFSILDSANQMAVDIASSTGSTTPTNNFVNVSAVPVIPTTVPLGTDIPVAAQNNGFFFFNDGGFSQAGSITGLAMLPSLNPNLNFEDDLFAISNAGSIYQVHNYDSNEYFQRNLPASSKFNITLLSANNLDPSGQPAHFTALTAGPKNVEGGKFAQLLFATDDSGHLYAFNRDGSPAHIFANGAAIVNTPGVYGAAGLAFSEVDYNLWHVTPNSPNGNAATAGHGTSADSTFDRLPAGGGDSFYFGLEDPRTVGDAYRLQPGNLNVLGGNQSYLHVVGGDPINSGNESLLNTYNVPGGAYGSLTSGSFSLAGYAATDKPTLYFNYFLDDQGGVSSASGANMLDSFRVFASADGGATWLPLATNNLAPSSLGKTDQELPTYLSTSGGTYQGDKSNQRVQPLYDQGAVGTPNNPDTAANPNAPATSPGWRQARVDLGDLAGKANVQLRFDYSTAGTMGTGKPNQNGSTLGALPGTQLTDGQTFVLDNSVVTSYDASHNAVYTTTNYTFTLRSGLVLQVPVSAGLAINQGETFRINGGSVFEFTKNGAVGAGHIAILINNSQSAEDVSNAIAAALKANPVAGVTPIQVADRIQLVGATTVVQSAGHKLLLQGSALPASLATTDVVYKLDMSAAQVADTMATAMDKTFAQANAAASNSNLLDYGASGNYNYTYDSTAPHTSAKVVGSALQIIGHNIVKAGTTLPFQTQLPGDQSGTYNVDIAQTNNYAYGNANSSYESASLRAKNNNHEGVYIDDFVVGFAGRGEMVTGSYDPIAQLGTTADPTLGDSAFITLPKDPDHSDPSRTLTGNFELTVRRSTSYAGNFAFQGDSTSPATALSQTFDINDRLASQFTITALAASQIVAGTTIVIALEKGPVTFTFVNATTGPNQIALSTGDTAATVATKIRDAINLAALSNGILKVTATTFVNGNRVSLYNVVDVSAPMPVVHDLGGTAIEFEVSPASQLSDGQTFVINSEDGSATYEIDFNNSVSGSNIPVEIAAATDQGNVVAADITKAINSTSALGGHATFTTKASAGGSFTDSSTGDVFGFVTLTKALAVNGIFQTFQSASVPGYGDKLQTQLQGETIVASNRISNSLQSGISVTPISGGVSDTGAPAFGTPGHFDSVTAFPTVNTQRLVPGISISNNLIVSAQTGIYFSGSPTSDVPQAVPFGRILNNTIVKTRFGIQVLNNAAPTVMNNVVAQSSTDGIFVDSSSAGNTVVGANAYQNNTANLVGTGETNAIVIPANGLLFVNPAKNNYYLAENSLAIDSSVNTLQERPALQAVTSPLGISASPIQAPQYDLFGQLRADDVNVATPPGVGQNVYIDRGAIDRVDFAGPVATLTNPVDNDAAGTDRDATVGKVLLAGQQLMNFSIQLSDSGVGVDDSTVIPSQFTVSYNNGTTTTTLNPGFDFTLAYDTTNKIAQLIPTAGVWTLGTYTITLNNSAANGIKDLAGNTLLPTSGTPQFVIQLVNAIASPWQDSANRLDVNKDTLVSANDVLIIINDLLSNSVNGVTMGANGLITAGTPTTPYLPDVNGDGRVSPQDALQIINYLNSLSGPQVVTAAAPAASPSIVATSSTVDSSSAVAAEDTSPIASGLTAASQTQSQSGVASTSASVATSTSVAPLAATSSAQASPQTASQTDSDAVGTTLAADDWDSSEADLDSILADLTPDLQQRRQVSATS